MIITERKVPMFCVGKFFFGFKKEEDTCFAEVRWEPKYVGQVNVQTHLREGEGTYVYDDGFFSYEGEWENNQKHGHGKLIFGDEGHYEGKFVNGEIVGQGKRYWAKLDATYEGDFSTGDLHGKGVYTTPTLTYEGDFVRNRRHGQGVFSDTATGVSYTGDFEAHKFHGQGSWKHEGGVSYEGQFVSGVFEGAGSLSDSSRQLEYAGEFSKNNIHGSGTMKYNCCEEHPLTYTGLLLHVVFVFLRCEYVPVDDSKAKGGKDKKGAEAEEDEGPQPLEEPERQSLQ
eukprot:gene567-11_t